MLPQTLPWTLFVPRESFVWSTMIPGRLVFSLHRFFYLGLFTSAIPFATALIVGSIAATLLYCHVRIVKQQIERYAAQSWHPASRGVKPDTVLHILWGLMQYRDIGNITRYLLLAS